MISAQVDVKYNNNIDDIVKKAIEKGILNGVNLVDKDAKKNCPADTGTLLNSIKKEYDFEKQVGTVSANTNYAIFVEYADGSLFKKKKARKRGKIPFLRPALYDNEKKIYDDIHRAIKEALSK